MLFRNEPPPPRHALDGDLDDTEATTTTKRELVVDVPPFHTSTVLLLAPRLAEFAPEFGATPLGRAELRLTTTYTATAVAPLDDFYEADPDAADFVRSESVLIPLLQAAHGLVIVQLPALSEADAAFAGRALVSQIAAKARVIVLATPAQSFMPSALCYFESHLTAGGDAGVSPPPSVPAASPPVIVQGAGAAALSRAQQLSVPALALVVQSDAPANHEAMLPQDVVALRTALFETLHLTPVSGSAVERDISALYV